MAGHNCPLGVDKNYGIFQYCSRHKCSFSAGEKDNVIPSRSSQTSSVRIRLVGFQWGSQLSFLFTKRLCVCQ